MGVRSGREDLLELHQGRGLRSRILQWFGTSRRILPLPSPIAAVRARVRFECFAEVGDQLWNRRGRNWRDGPHAGEGDHWPQVRVGQAASGFATKITVAVRKSELPSPEHAAEKQGKANLLRAEECARTEFGIRERNFPSGKSSAVGRNSLAQHGAAGGGLGRSG